MVYFRWILASGIISVVGGIFALMSPITATVVLVEFLACALIVIGAFMMLGVFFVEQCYRCASFIMGAAQLALGICMSSHLLTSMVILTGVIASLYMVLGVFQCALACGNSDLPGWGGYVISGICSVLFSAIVWGAFPVSATYTLGIICGCNWTINGIFRISIGFQGRSTAKTLMAAAGSNV